MFVYFVGEHEHVRMAREHFDGRAIDTDTDLAMYLLDDAHVATVAGSAFGTPGYIRFSYATSDDNLREAMRRIAEAPCWCRL